VGRRARRASSEIVLDAAREPPDRDAAGHEPDPRTPGIVRASRRRSRSRITSAARRPAYKGEELDAARGPGLGCFWFQAAVLAFFLVLIPIGVTLNWPFEVLAALLFVALGLLLFVGQTLIFLLRLVAADRRDAGRRRPLASATPTVGELEDVLFGVPAADVVGRGDAIAATESPTPPTVEPGSEGVRE
jgi:hypothetical protein